MREAYTTDVALWDQYLLDKLAALLISLNTWVLVFIGKLTVHQWLFLSCGTSICWTSWPPCSSPSTRASRCWASIVVRGVACWTD